jgi:hypothetical protein
MRAWQFDQATGLLTQARTILDERALIASRAAAAGLTAPTKLETAFEANDGFASATLEATAELEAIGQYGVAVAARPVGLDPISEIGLWGSAPEADLGRARTLFASGDLGGSAGASAAASSAWIGAEEIGRARLISAGGLLLAVLVAIILFGFWLRGRRRRPTALAAVDPYATLAATPDPLGPTERVEAVGSIEPVGSAEPVEPADAGSGSGGEGPDRWG